MLGCKIYFDGRKFIAEDKMSEVGLNRGNSTTFWITSKENADKTVEKYNERYLENVKKCKQCGEYFFTVG